MTPRRACALRSQGVKMEPTKDVICTIDTDITGFRVHERPAPTAMHAPLMKPRPPHMRTA